MKKREGVKEIRITEYSIIACVLVFKVWCSFLSQAFLFAVGGMISVAIDVVLCFYIFLNAKRKKNTLYTENNTNKLLIAWLGFAAVYSLIFALAGKTLTQVSFLGVFSLPHQVYNMLFAAMYLPALILVAKNLTEEERKILSTVLIGIFFLVSLFNLIVTISNPELVKNEAYNEGTSLFTLGYSGSYNLALVTPFLLYKAKNSKYKVLFWGMAICNVVSIFYGGYFIAVLATIVALVCYKLLTIKNRKVSIATSGLFIVLMIFFFTSGALEDFMWYLAERIPVDVIRKRCEEIARYLAGDTVVDKGDTTFRIYIYQDTFRNFLKHPILGNYIFGNYNCQWDHATILDLLSVGGIFLAGLFFAFLVMGYHFVGTLLPDDRARHTLLASIIVYIFIATINSAMSYSFFGILFAVAPILMGGKVKDEDTHTPSL